jgi:hypothetical protein
MITSPACRGEKRGPLSAVAVMIGRSRLALYRVLWTGRVSADMAEVLSPIIRAFETGRLKFGRLRPRSRNPNQWVIVGLAFTLQRNDTLYNDTLYLCWSAGGSYAAAAWLRVLVVVI